MIGEGTNGKTLRGRNTGGTEKQEWTREGMISK